MRPSKPCWAAGPQVLNHNLENRAPALSRAAAQARYRRSLEVLERTAAAGTLAKSGIMLGLGESRDELLAVFDDLLAAGCRMLTLGNTWPPAASITQWCAMSRPKSSRTYVRRPCGGASRRWPGPLRALLLPGLPTLAAGRRGSVRLGPGRPPPGRWRAQKIILPCAMGLHFLLMRYLCSGYRYP